MGTASQTTLAEALEAKLMKDGDAASPAGVRLVHAAHPCARRVGRIDPLGWRCAQSAAARSGERHRGDTARPAGVAALHGVSLRRAACARAGRALTLAA